MRFFLSCGVLLLVGAPSLRAAPQLPAVPLTGGFALRDDREPKTIHLAATAFDPARRALVLHTRGKKVLFEVEMPFVSASLEEEARKKFPEADNFLDLRWRTAAASLGRLTPKEGDKAETWDETLPLAKADLARDSLLIQGIEADGDKAGKLFMELKDPKSSLALRVTLTYEALSSPAAVSLLIQRDLARKVLLDRMEALGKTFEAKQFEALARTLIEAKAAVGPGGAKAADEAVMAWLLERRLVHAEKTVKAGTPARFAWNTKVIESYKGEEIAYESMFVFPRSASVVIVVPVGALRLKDASFMEN